MKTLQITFRHMLPLVVALVFSQCVAPYNSTMDSARMLNEGDVQIMGGIARYSHTSESEALNNNITGRVSYGINSKTNIFASYTRMRAAGEYSDLSDEGMHYFEAGPKFALRPNRIAVATPLGLYFSEGERTAVLSPKFLFTWPSASNKFEFTIATKADIFWSGSVLFGINMGLGFSSDLDKWAIRPELGYMSGGYFNMGVGITYNFQSP